MTAPLLSALHALLGCLGLQRDRRSSLPLGQLAFISELLQLVHLGSV